MKTAEEIRISYEARTADARIRGSQNKEFCDPTTTDMLYIRAVLHPTAKKESREMTRRLIELLCERGVCTMVEITEALGYSENPILKRLKLLRQNGYVRRESKKYYLPTHRMRFVHDNYLDRIC